MKIILAQMIAINNIPLTKLQLQNYLRGFHSMILKTDTDNRGTVAALVQEIAEAAKEFFT
ncbi:hypothetical protein EW026_g3769 [Hermanssonia centrifuga]|uniref:Uncharacterized protein n=1 Tax=Hermanssonia centrifuga TaxID=98765 RepID=A0A4S4KL41_9APHY|nr:hypothetical protein EW026_g3769 [Hermanssonia centrifuga]